MNPTTPAIALHLAASLGALLLGPVAVWARQGAKVRPRLHRIAGYTWVVLMLASALSALFIHDDRLPNIWGYSPIHLLVPLTLGGLTFAMVALFRRNLVAHRKAMQALYWQACVGAGVFTLLPSRYLGQLVWGHWLGLLG